MFQSGLRPQSGSTIPAPVIDQGRVISAWSCCRAPCGPVRRPPHQDTRQDPAFGIGTDLYDVAGAGRVALARHVARPIDAWPGQARSSRARSCAGDRYPFTAAIEIAQLYDNCRGHGRPDRARRSPLSQWISPGGGQQPRIQDADRRYPLGALEYSTSMPRRSSEEERRRFIANASADAEPVRRGWSSVCSISRVPAGEHRRRRSREDIVRRRAAWRILPLGSLRGGGGRGNGCPDGAHHARSGRNPAAKRWS